MKVMKGLANQSQYARSNFGGIVNFLWLVIFAAAMALPMVFTVSNAFKPLEELFVFPPNLIVKNPTLNNFAGISSVLRESWVPVGRNIINSFTVTAFGVLGQVIFASLAAYVLAKEVFPGSKMLNKVIVLSLMFNGTVTSIPTYIIMANLKLVNSHLALILPACSKSAYTEADVSANKYLAYDESLYTAPASITGFPAAVAGGVQIIGAPLSENTLFKAAEIIVKEGK